MIEDKEYKTCMMQESDKPESNDATDMQRNEYSDPGLLLILRYSPDMQQEYCKNGQIIYLRQQNTWENRFSCAIIHLRKLIRCVKRDAVASSEV